MTKQISTLCLHGLLLVCVGLFSACSDDNPWRYSDGEGGINPSVNTSTDIMRAPALRSEGIIDAPEPERFGLTLTKTDGSYTQTWASTTLFPTDRGFRIGAYSLEAFYGNMDDEGFERPFFYGKENFEVLEDRTTTVEITATLANSMVSIAYTDAFRRYFSQYLAKVHSEGGEYIDYPAAETRPVYVRPGKIDIALSITRPDGVSATLQPADFTAEARHHYRLTFDVFEGEVGQAQLRVIFDDTLDEENIEIDLSDELLTAPAPEVTPQGFTAGQPLELLEYTRPSAPIRFFIRAKSGITAATLTINSDASLPLAREYDLCSISPEQAIQLQNTGITETGLSRNPGTLAQVDLTEFIASLPAGTHTLTMVVKDKMTKINEPLELKINSSPLVMEIASVATVMLGSNEASMVINCNGPDLRNALSIKAMDDYGAMQPCNITSITEISGAPRKFSNGAPMKAYNVEFTLPESSRDVKISVAYKGQKTLDAIVKRSVPEYSITTDGFAHKAILKITAATEADTRAVVKRLRVFCGQTELNITGRDADRGLITISDLSPSKTYNINATVFSGNSPSFQAQASITTESEAQVPNGDFENLQQTFSATALEQGGKYTRTLISSAMQNHQAYTISEPTGWASTNAKTMNPNAATKNSWFMPASVFNTSLYFQSKQDTQGGMGGDTSTPEAYQYAAANGQNAMVVRNVAWDPAGVLPDTEKKTAVPSGYYNSKSPNIANRSAGLLFLGTYSYNGNDVISEGISFTSRPNALSGFYRYLPDSQDTGEAGTVTVKLMHGNSVIASGSATLTAAENYTQFTVPITYSTYFQKADRLCIMFSSSNRAAGAIKTTSRAQRFLQEAYGAVLVVDNLSFSY